MGLPYQAIPDEHMRWDQGASVERETLPSPDLAENQSHRFWDALKRDWPVWLVAAATFANGLLGIVSVLAMRATEERPELFRLPLPFGIYHASRLLTLTFGLLLVYLSFHLFQRRKAAWWLATAGTAVAALAHLGRGHVWYTALAPAATVVLLILFRDRYTVRSEPRSIAQGAGLMLASLLIALIYGTVGFWLLDKRDFGQQLSLAASLVRTLREISLVGNSDLVAHTRHARLFLESLDVFGLAAGLFAVYSLFRPVAFRLHTLPLQRATMKRILEQYGGTSVDYFKLWPDKSYFFSRDNLAGVAYRTESGIALALGDPVGAPEELEETTRAFMHYCADNGWAVAFHQAQPDLLSMYRRLGLDVLKIGEEAIVDLERFPETVKKHKHLRHTRNQFEKDGYRLVRHLPPHDPALLDQVEEVSREWLQIPGRHERSFSLGYFDRSYLNETPLAVLYDLAGRVIAFANEIPSYRPGEATFDLMRHRLEAPNGTMDYLFIALMLSLQEQGYRTFNMGMAAYSGVGNEPGATLEERAAHELAEHATHFFSYKGMRDFKGKFEPVWEDRFLIYQGGPWGLARTAVALMRATD
jgi:phosphatidylglycerol lysyltransferase